MVDTRHTHKKKKTEKTENTFSSLFMSWQSAIKWTKHAWEMEEGTSKLLAAAASPSAQMQGERGAQFGCLQDAPSTAEDPKKKKQLSCPFTSPADLTKARLRVRTPL